MVRIISISSISLVLRSAPLARVSKDGHRRDRARGHPSRRPREERGLLRMRSEGLNSIVRYDWFHGIDPLAPERCLTPTYFVSYPESKCPNRHDKQGAANRPRHNLPCTARRTPPSL